MLALCDCAIVEVTIKSAQIKECGVRNTEMYFYSEFLLGTGGLTYRYGFKVCIPVVVVNKNLYIYKNKSVFVCLWTLVLLHGLRRNLTRDLRGSSACDCKVFESIQSGIRV